MNLTQNLLKKLFDYRNGELYWKVAKSSNIKIDDIAGSVRKDGYRYVGIDGKYYLAHRLIFLYHNCYLPKFLDHIDGDPLNNDITNLREATLSQNQHNQKIHKSYNGKPTSSEYKGVSWDKQIKKWRAQIQIDDKKKNLGYFDTEIKAAEAYNRTATEAFGEFAKLNEVMK